MHKVYEYIIDQLNMYPKSIRNIAVLRYEQEHSCSSVKINELLLPMVEEIDRLEHFVSLLPYREQHVIKVRFFDRAPWDEVATKLDISRRTAQNIMKTAINHLVQMYELFVQVSQT